MFKIVAISDTHNQHKKLIIPPCDLLISCGDWTSMGYYHEVDSFVKWLNEQKQCKNIIVVPGNHEKHFELNLPLSKTWFDKAPNVKLLINESVEIDGIKIYGSPITPFFFNWAWNRYPDEIKPYWDAIPEDTDILITHGPPYGILDQTTYADGTIRPEHLGCPILMKRILGLKKLKLHVFGHIHHPGGTQHHENGTSFYNASICDEAYIPSNPLTIVEYTK